MLIRRKLPKSHLSDETKGVVTLSMGVVGTLTALVLSLLIATASSTFNTRNQEITVLAAKVIQLEHLVQRYGPEADGERDLLHLYAALKLQNLFPQGKTKPVLENPRTIILFEETTGPVGGKEGHSAQQRWLLSQALALTSDMAEVRWLLWVPKIRTLPVRH